MRYILFICLIVLVMSCSLFNLSKPPEIKPEKSTELELFSVHPGIGNIFCEPLEKSDPTLISDPVDIAVSKQTGKIYFVTNRCDQNVLGHRISTDNSCLHPNQSMVKRSFIYEVTSPTSAEAIKVNGVYPSSCHLSEEIEIDSQDNLFVNDVNRHKIVQISAELDQVLELGDFKRRVFLADPSAYPDGGIWSEVGGPFHLHVDQDQLFFFMDSGHSFTGMSSFSYVGSIKDKQILYYNYRPGNSSVRAMALSQKLDQVYLSENYSNSILNPKPAFVPFQDLDHISNLPKQNFDSFLLDTRYDPWNKTKTFPDATLVKEARFKSIQDMKLTPTGDLIICDTGYHAIFKISTDGMVTVLGGNGEAGFKDGKTKEAQFNFPVSIDLDAENNIYVADTGNHAIRKITPQGEVTTLYTVKQP